MEFNFEGASYHSRFAEDPAQGYVGVELWRVADGNALCVAKVLFWDAAGQFFVETMGCDIPVSVIEKLIAEARSLVPTEVPAAQST